MRKSLRHAVILAGLLLSIALPASAKISCDLKISPDFSRGLLSAAIGKQINSFASKRISELLNQPEHRPEGFGISMFVVFVQRDPNSGAYLPISDRNIVFIGKGNSADEIWHRYYLQKNEPVMSTFRVYDSSASLYVWGKSDLGPPTRRADHLPEVALPAQTVAVLHSLDRHSHQAAQE